VLLALELCLTLAGFGDPTALFIETQTPGVLTPNPRFVRFYRPTSAGVPHPCLVSAVKPADTIRVFVFGESAAMGTPDPSFGFARMLEFMLQQQLPPHRVEVINVAMRGINSHVLVEIARRCADLQPDLFVVYMGNNEVCGFYGPEAFLSRHPRLIELRRRFVQTRTGQLLSRVLHGWSASGDEPQTMEFFRKHRVAMDDPRREAVCENFRTNLTRMCDYGLASGAAVIVSTVGVNLRDCPPLASLHRDDLSGQGLDGWQSFYRAGVARQDAQDFTRAVAAYRRALATDDHYADLHYRMGQCRLAAGDFRHALECFSAARDWDALQFRTDSRLNEIIRRTVARYAGRPVYLVDVEAALAAAEACIDHIPGGEFFYDHVHLNFQGDYEVAKALAPTAVQAMRDIGRAAAGESLPVPSRQACSARLAFTVWDQANAITAMAEMTREAPFVDQIDHARRQSQAESEAANVTFDEERVAQIMQTYVEAIYARPDDWNLRYNFATLLYRLQQYSGAIEHIQEVVHKYPADIQFRLCLAHALAKTGRFDEAVAHYRLILKHDKRCQPARESLEYALRELQKARR
jgi:tetratricopeptide (TPR) repeat protein